MVNYSMRHKSYQLDELNLRWAKLVATLFCALFFYFLFHLFCHVINAWSPGNLKKLYLLPTKLSKGVTLGRRFRTQPPKSSPTSCFS